MDHVSEEDELWSEIALHAPSMQHDVRKRKISSDATAIEMDEILGDDVKCVKKPTLAQKQSLDLDKEETTPAGSNETEMTQTSAQEGAAIHVCGTPVRKHSDYEISMQSNATNGKTRSECAKKNAKKD